MLSPQGWPYLENFPTNRHPIYRQTPDQPPRASQHNTCLVSQHRTRLLSQHSACLASQHSTRGRMTYSSKGGHKGSYSGACMQDFPRRSNMIDLRWPPPGDPGYPRFRANALGVKYCQKNETACHPMLYRPTPNTHIYIQIHGRPFPFSLLT